MAGEDSSAGPTGPAARSSTQPKLLQTKSMPAAGFRLINTEVRRMGDFGDYYFDGSWKASSFANPPGYLEADKETPWTRKLNFKPLCGLNGPPAMWPIDHVTSTPAVPQDAIWEENLSLRANNLPRYMGYIPGKKAETVYGSIKAGIHDHCEAIRQYQEKDVSIPPLVTPNRTYGKKSLENILKTTDMKYTETYGVVRPDANNMKYVYKDHVIPKREKPTYATGGGIMSWNGFHPRVNKSLDGREPAYVVRGGLDEMPGYTGYRPGKLGLYNSPAKWGYMHE